MRKLAITSSILDKLGFSEYWDENGDWGGRTLTFTDGTRFRIIQQGELEDDNYGYPGGVFIGEHFTFSGFFALPEVSSDHDLFFLHEMQTCIAIHYPSGLTEFNNKCKALRMGVYLNYE